MARPLFRYILLPNECFPTKSERGRQKLVVKLVVLSQALSGYIVIMHPAFKEGNVGAADGIGLAATKLFASMGLKVLMADNKIEKLLESRQEIMKSTSGNTTVDTCETDVSSAQSVNDLKDYAYKMFGRVDILWNNAGISGPPNGKKFEDGLDAVSSAFSTIFATNIFGAVNGCAAFANAMKAQDTPAAIINTGSKQGITNPPGNTPYNASKAALKSVTESLAHELQDTKVSVHLIVPGFTYTGLIKAMISEKPPGAWEPIQVAQHLVKCLEPNERNVYKGDFYIICPDNEVTWEMDKKRMTWNFNDILENRPGLSRWNNAYKDEFARYSQK